MPKLSRIFDEKPKTVRVFDEKPKTGFSVFNEKPRLIRTFDEKPKISQVFDEKPKGEKMTGELTRSYSVAHVTGVIMLTVPFLTYSSAGTETQWSTSGGVF